MTDHLYDFWYWCIESWASLETKGLAELKEEYCIAMQLMVEAFLEVEK